VTKARDIMEKTWRAMLHVKQREKHRSMNVN